MFSCLVIVFFKVRFVKSIYIYIYAHTLNRVQLYEAWKAHSKATKKQNSHIISQNSLTRLCGQTPPWSPAFGIHYLVLECIVFHFPYRYTNRYKIWSLWSLRSLIQHNPFKIHHVKHTSVYFVLIVQSPPSVWMDYTLLISSVEGYLACFQFWASIKVAVNNCIKVFVWTQAFIYL